MEVVAAHLYQEAIKQANTIDKDQFGRTAFNRYYYATFLHVRKGLSRLNTNWSRLPHHDIPELLKGVVKKELFQGKVKAARVRDSDVVALCAKAESAAIELSQLMQEGYATRVVADYTPEVQVDFSKGSDFTLNSVAIKHARDWPHRALAYVGTITSAWKQIHD